MGVYAKNIGTEQTRPNTIQVGRNMYISQELEIIENKIALIEKDLDQVQQQNESSMQNIDADLKDFETLKTELELERNRLLEWDISNPGKAVVCVNGRIHEGTMVIGKHCQKILADSFNQIKLREMPSKKDQAGHEIKIRD